MHILKILFLLLIGLGSAHAQRFGGALEYGTQTLVDKQVAQSLSGEFTFNRLNAVRLGYGRLTDESPLGLTRGTLTGNRFALSYRRYFPTGKRGSFYADLGAHLTRFDLRGHRTECLNCPEASGGGGFLLLLALLTPNFNVGGVATDNPEPRYETVRFDDRFSLGGLQMGLGYRYQLLKNFSLIGGLSITTNDLRANQKVRAQARESLERVHVGAQLGVRLEF